MRIGLHSRERSRPSRRDADVARGREEPLRPTASTRLYLGAAHVVARMLAAPPAGAAVGSVDSPVVRSVYVRRSVAAGDAVFPRSDLDLGVVIEPCSGAAAWELLRRFRRARLLFPRLGECQVTTREELRELAITDPYRASLDRRAAVRVLGEAPEIPQEPLEPLAVARRLVFWLDHYVPWASRRSRRRDQRKFVLEMANALGVLTGRWPEPLISRRAMRGNLDDVAPDTGESPFVQCLRIAERAHVVLHDVTGRTVPRLDAPVVVGGGRPIVLLPRADDAWPAAASRSDAMVVTPPALDLLLVTQLPFLWLDAGDALAALGFAPPPRATWIATCKRQAGGERLRNPGFSDRGPGAHARRLARVRAVVEWMEAGATGAVPAARPTLPEPRSLREYYVEQLDELTDEAADLRARVRKLERP